MHLLMLAPKQRNVKPRNYTNASKSSPCKQSIFCRDDKALLHQQVGSSWCAEHLRSYCGWIKPPAFVLFLLLWICSTGHRSWPPLKACQQHHSTGGEAASVSSWPLLQPLQLCLSQDPGLCLSLVLLSAKPCLWLSWWSATDTQPFHNCK